MWANIAAWFESAWADVYKNLIASNRYEMYLSGLGVTLVVALSAAVMGLLIGIFVALMRLSKYKVLRGVAGVYVDIIRGTPVVVQLLIMYFIIMISYRGPKTVVAVITFGLNSGAYVSEMVRGGILAVDKGQTEAGRSLGLSAASTMRLIVIPQMLKITLPSILNEFIMLLKETSVVGYIGLMDLAKAGDFVRGRTYSPYTPLLLVAAIYLIIILTLSRVFARIERKVRESDIR